MFSPLKMELRCFVKHLRGVAGETGAASARVGEALALFWGRGRERSGRKRGYHPKPGGHRPCLAPGRSPGVDWRHLLHDRPRTSFTSMTDFWRLGNLKAPNRFVQSGRNSATTAYKWIQLYQRYYRRCPVERVAKAAFSLVDGHKFRSKHSRETKTAWLALTSK
jgi:hypothetical protein